MTRDSRYDILFEPVRIGPVTARNRFYQVPHCNGMGYRDVSALAAMRGMKAEGGWAVVCTEMTEIHHGADVAPYVELRIWDDHDIPTLARIAEKIHEHGSLAGIELCHSGYTASNLYSREVADGADGDDSLELSLRSRSMPAPWTRRTSGTCAGPTAPPPFAPAPPATTSSMSMPATGSASSSSSSRAPPISAAMNMAARSKTAPACCAK